MSEIMTAFSFIQYHVISDLETSCKQEKPQWYLSRNKVQVYSYYRTKTSAQIALFLMHKKMYGRSVSQYVAILQM